MLTDPNDESSRVTNDSIFIIDEFERWFTIVTNNIYKGGTYNTWIKVKFCKETWCESGFYGPFQINLLVPDC